MPSANSKSVQSGAAAASRDATSAAEAARRIGRVLHLFANYKWTGPADPAIRSAASLRTLGVDAVFAQAEWTLPEAEHRMAKELWRRRMPVIAGLALKKHLGLRALHGDVAALTERVLRDRYSVLHAHLQGDHLLAALVCRRLRAQGHRAPLLVRSMYEPKLGRPGMRLRLAMRGTDGLIVPTPQARREALSRFKLSPAQVLFQDPAVEPVAADGDQRAAWGLDASHRVVGITARIQPHRRFKLLWDVARLVADTEPNTRFVLLGRGNDKDTRELVKEPIARLGLEGHVILPGYQMEPDYSRALATLDVFLFLVPGSDGTCRAVREAMVRGLPVVTTERGILPSLVQLEPPPEDGPVPKLDSPWRATACGALCREDAPAMAGALLHYLQDDEARAAAGLAARSRAREFMDPDTRARELLAFYGRLVHG